MWHQGARATLVIGSLFLAACGAKTLDFTGPDGGAGNSGTSTGSGGTTGGSTGTGGAAGGGAGTAGGTGGGAGTAGGSGGAAGTGGGNPGPFVTRPQALKATKIDLLVMIDNSSSMADKQAILSTAVPDLVDRLIHPGCVDPVTGRVVGSAANGVCTVGQLAFEPVKDIQIGIISSSLGNHGASGVCEDAIDASLGRSDPHNNDRAHLLTRGPGGVSVPTWNEKGFIVYNPTIGGGLTTSAEVAARFTDLVKGVGQHGCGYEASLESVYRFLVDPEPYDTIRIDTSIGGFGQALLNGTDQALLQQRADFLRPDSLVSIVLLTDENDCSVVDGGQAFYALLPPVAGTGRSVLKPGTSMCKQNPNDKCCFNCGVLTPPAGCADHLGDPECMKGELLVVDDQPNLRCFEQKRRYGVDLLYPVQRYIDGFTKTMVPNRKLEMVPNPLFSDLTCPTCPPWRDPSLVLVTGIVGVPWQDIAVDPNDLIKGYKTARQLRDENVWATIVGDPLHAAGPVPPRDPHMIESIKPRAGLAGPASPPAADPVHGHEWDPSKDTAQPNANLQYACTFPLDPPKICATAQDCDCNGPNLTDVMNPLCQNSQGAYTTTQLRGKAYPGTRLLQVLQGLGDRGVVGSICPANVLDRSKDDFGYTPVINALLDRMRRPLGAACLPVALPVDAAGQIPCAVIEVFNDSRCSCDFEPGRRTAPDALLTAEMKAQGSCRCEITQLSDIAQSICRSTPNPPTQAGNGWCYIDPAQISEASCDIVRSCAADEKRLIRFINANSEPRPGATAFLRCETPPIAPLPSRCP